MENLPIFKTSTFAKVANGIRIYGIGDVHGRNDLLRPLLARIREHIGTHPIPRPMIVFLGDYIDRGPFSKQVIDQLILLRQQLEVVFLKGNHEHYLLEFLKAPSFLSQWIQWGGLDTLRSYDVLPNDHSCTREQELLAMSLSLTLHRNAHFGFLSDLRNSFTCGDFFFAHAGVRPGVSLDHQDERDLLEIRNDFLLCQTDLGKIVVHGHTPVPQPDIRSNRINIDTGAYATGNLSCLVIERDELRFM